MGTDSNRGTTNALKSANITVLVLRDDGINAFCNRGLAAGVDVVSAAGVTFDFSAVAPLGRLRFFEFFLPCGGGESGISWRYRSDVGGNEL